MSCAACEIAQDDMTGAPYYYRWKDADIQIRGCAKHVEEVMTVLNHYQSEQGESS